MNWGRRSTAKEQIPCRFVLKSRLDIQELHIMLQAYLKKNKLGKYNEEEMAALAKEKEEREAAETKMVGVDEIMVEEGMLILI